MSIALERRLRLLESRVAELEHRKVSDTRVEAAGPSGRPTPTVPTKRRATPKKDRTAQ